jgi:hypothetical protein
MLRDPLIKWNGPFPYDVLAIASITPESDMKAVREASYDLMSQGLMTAEARQAWDELRLVPRRLFVDFFLYPVDLSAEIDRASERVEQALDELITALISESDGT